MDKEYVEREALLERLSYNGPMNLSPMEYYREVVTKFPTADVEPVRHGEWIENRGGPFILGYKCSLCDCYIKITTEHYNPSKFCPDCGARMDGGNKNE